MLNPEALGRVINWKFHSALTALDGTETEDERVILESLDAVFGNAGWGMDGHMGVILEALVDRLVKESDSVDGHP